MNCNCVTECDVMWLQYFFMIPQIFSLIAAMIPPKKCITKRKGNKRSANWIIWRSLSTSQSVQSERSANWIIWDLFQPIRLYLPLPSWSSHGDCSCPRVVVPNAALVLSIKNWNCLQNAIHFIWSLSGFPDKTAKCLGRFWWHLTSKWMQRNEWP